MRIHENQSQDEELSGRGEGYREAKRKKWLSDTVSKKGNRVLAWSIRMPNNRCPFASKVCSKNCYAMTGQFTFHDERYAENYQFTFNSEFVETITTEIVQFSENHANEAVSVALHEKGEIYSIPYLNKWEEIISATGNLTNLNYFIYTRAWRNEEFRTALEELAAKHSNVRVNLSTDSDMTEKYGVPQPIGDGLVTWLAETDSNIPSKGVDLVFRNLRVRHDSPMERLGDALVCPYESKLYIGLNKNGRPALERGKCKPIRCQECRLCIDRSFDEWEKTKGQYAGTPGQEPALDIATPANETECLFGAEDLQLLLPSELEETPNPTSDKECDWDAKINREITRYQSKVIETYMDAYDHGVPLASYTRDRLTNTAIVSYQLANTILPPREEP